MHAIMFLLFKTDVNLTSSWKWTVDFYLFMRQACHMYGRLVCKCTCGLGDSVFSTGVWDHYRWEASHLPECVLPADEENPQRLWAVCLPQRGGWEHQTQLTVSQQT